MGFNHEAWPLGQGAGAESDTVQARLDWHGLRARFLAARACRESLGGRPMPDEVTNASFDRSAARALAEFDEALHRDGSRAVNLDDSVDGKGPSGNSEDVASASTCGVRG